MKNLFNTLMLFLLCNALCAQTTVTLTLNANDEDADLANWAPSANIPDPNEPEYASRAWTNSGTPVVWRSFFKFNLSGIPQNAIIQSARLSLYYADVNSFGNLQHSSLTRSNESVLRRVLSPWSESTVTWNTQPSSTTANQVILPQSTSGTQDYLNMDVTGMVQQMMIVNNYGFSLRLTNELHYAQMFFASGDNPHTNKHPTLTITYSTAPNLTCLNLTLNSGDEDAGVANWAPSVNANYPNEIEYVSRAWTISNVPVIWRNFFKFNLSGIPGNAIVTSAFLSLYYADVNTYSNAQHSSLTHSNESIIERVTAPWSENTLTWNNQPSASSANLITLPQSTSGTQDYLEMNVTPMVQQMVSGNNYGFLLRLTNEIHYAQMFFESGDHPNQSKHPQLQVCYYIPNVVPALSVPALIMLGVVVLLTGILFLKRMV